jgi:hypothetical protein
VALKKKEQEEGRKIFQNKNVREKKEGATVAASPLPFLHKYSGPGDFFRRAERAV